MPIKPLVKINGVDVSKVLISIHCDRNLENQDADRCNLILANPYGKLSGKFARGNVIEAKVFNHIRGIAVQANPLAYDEEGNSRLHEYAPGKFEIVIPKQIFKGNIYTIEDSPRGIQIVATCKITSLSKNIPGGFVAEKGSFIGKIVEDVIKRFNAIAAEGEKIEVAEIWQPDIQKDQLVTGEEQTYIDIIDKCCEASGGFYYFDDEAKFHFCEPDKQAEQHKEVDITHVCTNPDAAFTQVGYANVQTVIGSSENPAGTLPASQDRHEPVMATYVSPAVEEEGEAKVIAPPLYLPYVTTEKECLQIAQNMVKNFNQYKNATQDLELVNGIIQPLDHVKYATGLRYGRGKVCNKIFPIKPGEAKGLVRRAVTDISVKGWRQKLETCAPPSQSEEESQKESSPAAEANVKTVDPVVKTYGQPPYGWTKEGYHFFFAEQSLYDKMEVELHDRGVQIEPNSWMYINPDSFDPAADPSTWDIARYGQDQVPPTNWKMIERWDNKTAPGDIDSNINAFHF